MQGTILTYNKKGADWPGMCQAGSAQSPINIVTKGERCSGVLTGEVLVGDAYVDLCLVVCV